MRVPRALCGMQRSVLRACKRLSVPPFDFSSLDQGTLPADEAPGLIVLEAGRSIAGQEHVHLYALAGEVQKNAGEGFPAIDAHLAPFVLECQRYSWGTLALMNNTSAAFFLRRPEYQEGFVRACLEHWREWDAAGPRFMEIHGARPWWDCVRTLFIVLGRKGMGKEILDEVAQGRI